MSAADPERRRGRYVPDPERIARKVAETRAAQGLPEQITDPLVFDEIAALMRPCLEQQAAEVVRTHTRRKPSQAA